MSYANLSVSATYLFMGNEWNRYSYVEWTLFILNQSLYGNCVVTYTPIVSKFELNRSISFRVFKRLQTIS